MKMSLPRPKKIRGNSFDKGLLSFLGIMFFLAVGFFADFAKAHEQSGKFPAILAGESISSPFLYDLDGDGIDEIIVTTLNGYIQVINSQGESWNNLNWPCHLPKSSTTSPIVIPDSSGNPVIVAATVDGRIFGYNIQGQQKWSVDTRVGGLPNPMVESSPIAGDLNNDGSLQIVIPSSSGRIFVLSSEGERLNTYNADSSISSNPIIKDLDGDGKNDIIFKSDDGNIHALTGNRYLTGFPVKNAQNAGSCPFDIQVADLDNSGKLGIISSTGKIKDNYYLSHISAQGKVQSLGQLPGKAPWQPVIADIDSDGIPEIILTTVNGFVDIRRMDGSSLTGFPAKYGNRIEGPPAFIDIDGDGKCDIIFTVYTDDSDPKSALFAISSQGKILSNFPIEVGRVSTKPILTDLDKDGKGEILIMTLEENGLMLLKAFSMPGGAPFSMLVLGSQFHY